MSQNTARVSDTTNVMSKYDTLRKLLKEATSQPPDRTTVCGICLEAHPKKVSILMSCHHQFCTKCILKWLKGDHASTCPMCRSPVYEGECVGYQKYVRMMHTEVSGSKADWNAGGEDLDDDVFTELMAKVGRIMTAVEERIANPNIAAIGIKVRAEVWYLSAERHRPEGL